MWPGVKSCCSPDGHCKTKTPSSQNSNRECQQIAFDHHKSVDFHIDSAITIIAAVKIELPMNTVAALKLWRGADLTEPSPPDLQILHSTFLI
jgi:hypothetical protein